MSDALQSLLDDGNLQPMAAELERQLNEHPSDAKLHAALSFCLVRLGRVEEAAQEARKAFVLDEQLFATGMQYVQLVGQLVYGEHARLQANLQSAAERLPGPTYHTALSWIHEALKPKAYVEIGVHMGDSLALASPSTRSIGIDPTPVINVKLSDSTMVVELASDDFFAQRDLEQELGSPTTFDLAFIDGLHLWEQALRDFANLEPFARRDSVILIHDCLPLDDLTSRRVRDSLFFSGDVWKAAACLRCERPDLRMAIVPARPTGLCLVTNLNPQDKSLWTNYDRLLKEWTSMGYSDYLRHPEWAPVRLQNRQSDVVDWLKGR